MDEFLTQINKQINELTIRQNELTIELTRVQGELQGLTEARDLYRDCEEIIKERRAEPDPKKNRPSRAGRKQHAPDPNTTEWWRKTLAFMEGAPREGVTVPYLVERMKIYDVDIHPATMQMTLSRAVRDGIVERPQMGYYRLVAVTTSPPPKEKDSTNGVRDAMELSSHEAPDDVTFDAISGWTKK